MNLRDMGVPDVAALVQFGALGFRLFAARVLSFSALAGVLGLAFYTVYIAPSWPGVAIVAIAAVCLFIPAVKAESTRQERSDEQT